MKKTFSMTLVVLLVCTFCFACFAMMQTPDHSDSPQSSTVVTTTSVSSTSATTTKGTIKTTTEATATTTNTTNKIIPVATIPTTQTTKPYAPGTKPTNNLNALGFTNTYGYSKWMSIDGYNFNSSEGYVYLKGNYEECYGKSTFYYGYKNGYGYYIAHGIYLTDYYFEDVDFYYDGEKYEALGVSYIPENDYRYAIDNASNDVIQYSYRPESYQDVQYGAFEITDRVTEKSNRLVILKTSRGKNHEVWYVPVDLIDWSCSPEYDSEKGYTKFWLYK